MDLSILDRDTEHMTLMDEPATVALGRDLEEFQVRVELARRNPWHGGDVIAPEYARFLSSLAERPAYAAGFAAAGTRNAWREALEQLS